jgi:hypothetical protein
MTQQHANLLVDALVVVLLAQRVGAHGRRLTLDPQGAQEGQPGDLHCAPHAGGLGLVEGGLALVRGQGWPVADGGEHAGLGT